MSGDVGAAENPEFECQGCGARATDDGADSLLGWSHDESGELAFCAACTPSGDVGAEVAAVLAAHALIRWTTAAGRGGSWSQCACGVGRSPTPESHAAHQADALAPLIAERVEAAKAEAVALRERVEDALSLAEQRQHPMDPRAATVYVADVRAALDPEEG